MVNNFIGGGPPEPLGSQPPDRDVPRKPRGTPAGGRFAEKRIISEPEVDLGGDVGYEPDGSKAFEERSGKRQDEAAEQSVDSIIETPQVEVTPDTDARVLAEMEAGLRGQISDDYFFEDEARLVNPTQKEPIQLGGKVSFSDTWNFPPSSQAGVERLADFFARVEIFDSVIFNIEAADRWGRDVSVYEQEYKEWFNSARAITKRFQRNNPEEAALLSAEYDSRHQFIEQIRHGAGLIPRSELRDVARLYGFFLQTRDLPGAEKQQAAVREFIDSSGSIVTPLDVTHKYRLWEIGGAWFGRQKYPRYD